MKNQKRGRPALGKEVVRFTISVPALEHKILVEAAENSKLSLSAFVLQRTLAPQLASIRITATEIEFFKTIIELLGPLTLVELIDVLQKHQTIKTNADIPENTDDSLV
jgi:hypothetical protein